MIVSLDVHTGNSLIRIKRSFRESWSIMRFLISSELRLFYISIGITAFLSICIVFHKIFYGFLKKEYSPFWLKKISVALILLFFFHTIIYLFKDYVFQNVKYSTNNISNQVKKLIPRQAIIGVMNEDIFRILAYNMKNRFIFIHDLQRDYLQLNKSTFDKFFKAKNISYFAFLDQNIDAVDINAFIKDKCKPDAFSDHSYFSDKNGEQVIKIVDLNECNMHSAF